MDKAVEPKLLLSLLEAARWAPSSFNEQPWVFLVATKEQPEEFEKMLGCLVEANQGWAKAAPVLMISVAKLSFTKNGKENRCALHDVGLASAMLTLQAVELGLSTHGMAGIEIEKIRSIYGVPEGYAPMAGWAVGYDGDPDQLEGGLREAEESPAHAQGSVGVCLRPGLGQVLGLRGAVMPGPAAPPGSIKASG